MVPAGETRMAKRGGAGLSRGQDKNWDKNWNPRVRKNRSQAHSGAGIQVTVKSSARLCTCRGSGT